MNTPVKQRFCPYCRHFKPDVGFKFIVHLPSRSTRGQCPACQERRKLSRAELAEMARKDSEARSKALSEATRRGIEKKRLRDRERDQ